MIRGVICFLIIVLITIGDSFADGSCTGTLGEQNHNCDSGEFWSPTAQDCITCEAGRYCPRISPTNNGIAYCCPEPFTESDYGAIAVNDCYTTIHCDSNDVNVYCSNFDDNNNCAIDTENSGYSVQGYFDQNTSYHNSPNPKVSYQKYIYLVYYYGDIDPENPNGYHIELKPHYDAPHREQVPDNSWTPTSYTLQCVRNTMPCSTFVNDPYDYTFENNNQYDSISSTLEATNCPTGELIGDGATWNSENSVWDVSACKCKMPQDGWIEDPDRLCMKNGPIVRNALAPDQNAPINTVHSIYENIIFSNTGTIANSSAVCRKCLPDQTSPPYTRYYVAGLTNGYVEHCTPMNQNTNSAYGYYRDRSCGDYDWGESTQPYNPCPRIACPRGKTTTDFIPVGVDNCQYNNQTKFCDVNGCFNITDIMADIKSASTTPTPQWKATTSRQ